MPGVTALFGRSGCGKSTVISADRRTAVSRPGPRADRRRRAGSTRDAALEVDARHRRVGVVFQDARLFPHLSVLGNLQYGAQRLPRGTADADRLRRCDRRCWAWARSLRAGRMNLSGGEKQRVALGRALLAQPRLLLLDEPLASLDLARREEVLPYLERLRDALAIPIVYVSHQFDEVLRLATRVVLLDAGRVRGRRRPRHRQPSSGAARHRRARRGRRGDVRRGRTHRRHRPHGDPGRRRRARGRRARDAGSANPDPGAGARRHRRDRAPLGTVGAQRGARRAWYR